MYVYYTLKFKPLDLGRGQGVVITIVVIVTNTMGNLRQVDLIKVTINKDVILKPPSSPSLLFLTCKEVRAPLNTYSIWLYAEGLVGEHKCEKSLS